MSNIDRQQKIAEVRGNCLVKMKQQLQTFRKHIDSDRVMAYVKDMIKRIDDCLAFDTASSDGDVKYMYSRDLINHMLIHIGSDDEDLTLIAKLLGCETKRIPVLDDEPEIHIVEPECWYRIEWPSGLWRCDASATYTKADEEVKQIVRQARLIDEDSRWRTQHMDT